MFSSFTFQRTQASDTKPTFPLYFLSSYLLTSQFLSISGPSISVPTAVLCSDRIFVLKSTTLITNLTKNLTMYSVAVGSFVLLVATSVFAAPMHVRSDAVAVAAGGAPPNGPLPANISDAATTALQAVNFLENIEAAFYEEGLKNLTKWNDDHKLDFTIDVITKVHAVSSRAVTHIHILRTLQLTPTSLFSKS